ncbi:unnamed protein product, partial [marine sediment metagenome]
TDTDSVTEHSFKTSTVDSDINVQEGWSASVIQDAGRNRMHFDAIITQRLTHVDNLNAASLQAINNGQAASNTGNGGLIDRFWNINETDAFAVLLNKVVADAVAAAMEGNK